MQHIQHNDDVSIYQSNFRAEDGLENGPTKALYEGVVVPLVSLFAVFLLMVGIALFSH